MLLFELFEPTEGVIRDFVKFASSRLGLKKVPRIKIIKDVNFSHENHSFGYYSPEEHLIVTQIKHRQIVDILRTLAHELVHARQNLDGVLHSESGETGSPEENEANSVAGVIMREYGKKRPELFGRPPE